MHRFYCCVTSSNNLFINSNIFPFEGSDSNFNFSNFDFSNFDFSNSNSSNFNSR